jgi:radical SAM/Cys-rich protein
MNNSEQFESKLCAHGLSLTRGSLQTLQINVGRKCNQACHHCHVEAAPWRAEMMSAETARSIGEWIQSHRPAVVDITGGAPELSKHFRYLVETARGSGCHIIDRCNLTIIETDAYAWLPDYLATHEVEVVASLPCYLEENVDAQRGDGVFEKSICALKKLNAVGYGSRLPLNLVFNPVGPRLPPVQTELEGIYKRELRQRYGIEFTALFTITNQPIGRFADDLRLHGKWNEYMEFLANSFNPSTIENLMCRSTLSVGWRGEIYDCDFNQMLGMQIRNGEPVFLWNVTPADLERRHIQTDAHCFACTAGGEQLWWRFTVGSHDKAQKSEQLKT